MTGEELQRGKMSKGYEFSKNRYLILSDEDFESVKVDSSSIMSVEKFVDAGSIDPIYYDGGYYLAPDGKAGEDVYAVLREAIAPRPIYGAAFHRTAEKLAVRKGVGAGTFAPV